MWKFINFAVVAAGVSVIATQPNLQLYDTHSGPIKPGQVVHFTVRLGSPVISNLPEAWIVDTLKVNQSGAPTAIIGYNQLGLHAFPAPRFTQALTNIAIKPAAK